jgi:hypothetical protein
MSELDKKSPEDIYNGYSANNYPELAEHIKDPRTAGLEIKRHLQSLPQEVAYSNWQRTQNHGNLPKEGRQAFYQNAKDEVGTNRETVTAIQKGIYTPNLETLDTFPRFAIDTFNTGTVTQKGAIANAKIFTAVKQLSTSENRPETDRITETEFHKTPPELLGMQLAQTSGVKMTTKEQRTYGYAMAKIHKVMVKRNPTLANNMAYYTMGNGKKQLTCLMNDEKFTTQAVKDTESQKTSAWLANTLNVKQRDRPTLENLFKTEPKTTPNTIVDNAAISIKNTSSQTISSKQSRNKPLELLEMQKRNYEENLKNTKNY